MIHLAECYLCHSPNLSDFLKCKDYTASNETFTLQQCQDCGFLFTNPRPEDTRLSQYYPADNYVSHSDRSGNLINTLYRSARAFTLKWKSKLVQKNTPHKVRSVFDYGCGTGAFLQECQRNNILVSGLEPAPAARAIASENTGIKIHSDLSTVKGAYDVITLWHVLEHVADLNPTIQKLSDLLAPNGRMFIAVPNHQSHDAKKYQEYWAGYDVPRHLWHFTRQTMTRLLHVHKLTVVSVLPMRLDAYYVALLSEKYRNGKFTATSYSSALVSGAQSNRHAQKTKEYSSLIYVVRK